MKIEEIQNNKVRILYEELEDKFKLSEINFDKTEVINKIKEENFDKNKLIQWIESKLPKPMSELNPEVQKLFDEFENEYSLSSIIPKDEIIKKIIELNCDREELEKWIEDIM